MAEPAPRQRQPIPEVKSMQIMVLPTLTQA